MGSRFFEVMTAHWPVFALLAAVGLVMGLIAFLRGTAYGGDGCGGGCSFRLGLCLCAAAFALRLGIGFGVECGVGHF